MPFYAVKRGLTTGVFQTWLECQAQVVGYANARYKKFPTLEEAQGFVSAPHTPSKNSGGGDSNSKEPSLATVAKALASPSLSNNAFVAKVDTAVQQQRLHEAHAQQQLLQTGVKRKRFPSPSNAHQANKPLPLVAIIDGACHDTGRGNPRAGIGVYFGDKHPWNVSERYMGRQTKNAADIAAARIAVEIAERERIASLEVHTNSLFLISCLTSWLPKWRANGWRLVDGTPVKVREEIEALVNLLDQARVRVLFRHVRGNEMADQLANQGADAPLLGDGLGDNKGGVIGGRPLATVAKTLASPSPAPSNAPSAIAFTKGVRLQTNGRGHLQAGIGVYFGDRHPWNVSETLLLRGAVTSNAAEIAAARRAVEIAEQHGVADLKIQAKLFIIDLVAILTPKWKANGWHLADGTPVRERPEVELLVAALENGRVRVEFHHCPDHSVQSGAEMARQLALRGATLGSRD